MNEGLISRRYAKALLEYAAAQDAAGDTYRRMKILMESLRRVPKLHETLESPVVSPKRKIRLIVEAAGGGEAPVVERFARLVLKEERTRELFDIAYSYVTLYRRVHNISVVELTSAVEMPAEALDRIRRDVESRTHGTVEFRSRIDPAIEGGLILQIDDMRMDASVRGQVERVRRQFIQRNRTIV